MTETLVIEESTEQVAARYRLWHLYPSVYRGINPPPLGERALCGKEYVGPNLSKPFVGDADDCVVCASLLPSYLSGLWR